MAYFETVPANITADGTVISEEQVDQITTPTLENQDRVEQRVHPSSRVRAYTGDDL